MVTQEAQKFQLRENLATLFRHKRKIVLVLVTSVLVALAGSYLLSKVFLAEVRVLVQNNRVPLQITPALGQAGLVSSVVSPQEELLTEIEIFKSPYLATRVVERLGAEVVLKNMRWRWDFLRELPGRIRSWVTAKVWSYEPVRNLLESFGLRYEPGVSEPAIEAAEKLKEGLDVSPIAKATVFQVQFEAPRPEFAALAANTFVEVYLEQRIAIRRPIQAREFYTEEARRLRGLLGQAEERLQNFKRDNGIYSIDKQKNLLLGRLNQLETQRVAAEKRAIESRERIAGLSRQIGGQGGNVQISQVRAPSPLAAEIRKKLIPLEIERARYTSGSLAAARLDQEIAGLRSKLQSVSSNVIASEVSGVSTAYQSLQARLVSSQSDRRAALATLNLLNNELANMRAELNRLDRQAVTLGSMRREVELKEQSFKLFFKKNEEARVNVLLDEKKVSNVRPIAPASVPVGYIRPRKMFNTILGILVGLLGGIGVAYLSEFLRRTLSTKEEAEEALAQPVLASVLWEGKKARERGANLLEFRRLGENLLQLRRQRSISKILLSSALEEEGKSFIGLNLANALGLQGGKVLLVQADFSKFDTARTGIGLKNKKLVKPSSVTSVPIPMRGAQTNVDHLNMADQVSELGNLEEMYRRSADAVERLAHGYDFILVEASALDSCPEQLLLASEIGAVLFVVEAERTPSVTAVSGLGLLHETGATVLGVVLNKRRHIIPPWAYRWLLSPKRTVARAA